MAGRRPKALNQAERALRLADVLDGCGAAADVDQLAAMGDTGRRMAAALARLDDPPSEATWAAAVAVVLDRSRRPQEAGQ